MMIMMMNTWSGCFYDQNYKVPLSTNFLVAYHHNKFKREDEMGCLQDNFVSSVLHVHPNSDEELLELIPKFKDKVSKNILRFLTCLHEEPENRPF